jgi:hypothetical protein
MGCLGDSALVSAYESEVEEEGTGVDLLSGVRVADGPLFSFSSDLEAALMGLTIQVRSSHFPPAEVPRIRDVYPSDPDFFPSRIQQLQKEEGKKFEPIDKEYTYF